jgi:hypothetical protein
MENSNGEKKGWQKICAKVAEETNPHRLSSLIEELIKALDAHRQELDCKMTKPTTTNSKDLTPNASRTRDPESISLPLPTLKKLWV